MLLQQHSARATQDLEVCACCVGCWEADDRYTTAPTAAANNSSSEQQQQRTTAAANNSSSEQQQQPTKATCGSLLV
jgi:hypothetical protein